MGAIALVDYGAGNLASVRKALAAVGAEVFAPGRPAEVRAADAIVVPGVGHFSATGSLDRDWREAIREAVEAGRPLLGICLGLQWLFEGSTEAPGQPGLGVFEGRCGMLPSEGLKIPHVGWNTVDVIRPSRLLAGVPSGSHAYFTHSYAAPVTDATTATTSHGVTFASAVERGNVFGVQFHPEKSGDAGLAVLTAFVRIARGE